MRAETEQTLIDDLIDLGSRLVSTPNLREVQERDRALHLALDAIAAAGGDKPWLIVYDNVEKPGAIRKLKPRERTHILITSRWQDWQDEAQELPVDVFAREVAIGYLLARRPHETREAAGRLAEALGYLPLAFSHARAYCVETNLSFDNYARRLSELIQEAPEDAEYPASVFATFSLAIAKAAEACPEAEKLMEIAAFLAPERIPLDIITENVMSEKQREKAVAALFRVSLIEHETTETGSRAVSLHRLVQEVVRAQLNERTLEVASKVLHLVNLSLASGDGREHTHWPLFQRLLPHAKFVIENSPEADETAIVLAELCANLSAYLHARAAYAEAELLLNRALNTFERKLGSDSPAVESCLNNLAGSCLAQGRYNDAERLFKQALAIAEKRPNRDPLSVAPILNNLAYLYEAQDRFDEAERLFLRALSLVREALSPTDPLIATALRGLATLYEQTERHEEAERLFTEALTLKERVLGLNHPDVGVILHDLGALYRKQRRYKEAKKLFMKAFTIRKKTLGRDHPDFSVTLNSLAVLFSEEGRLQRAELLYKCCLAIDEKALGEEHPQVGSQIHNLAQLYHNQSRYDEAEQLYKRALRIRKKALGEEHLDFAMSLHSLAAMYRKQSRYGEAEPLFIQALRIREKVLGMSHPGLASTLNSLAVLHSQQGNHKQAEPFFLRALAVLETGLGINHPETEFVRANYERSKRI